MKALRIIYTPVFLALLLLSSSFSSAFAVRGWGNAQAVNTMEDAFDYLLSAKSKVLNGQRGWAVKSDMRRAYYKLRQAKWALNSSGGSYQAIEAIDVAVEKLQDRHLRTNEKLNFAIDCLMVAFTDTLNSARRVHFAARKIVSLAQKINELCLFDVLARLLQGTSDIVYQVRNPHVSEALGVTLEKITDPYLSPNEKYQFVKECLDVAEQALFSGGHGRR